MTDLRLSEGDHPRNSDRAGQTDLAQSPSPRGATPLGPRSAPLSSARADRQADSESGSPDFLGSADEPWRPREPADLAHCGVSEALVQELVLRFLLSAGQAEGRQIAEQLKLPFRILVPLLDQFKQAQWVAYKAGTATHDYVHVLTQSGRSAAERSSRLCSYFGSCPVSLADYIASVRRQSIEGQSPKHADLQRAFADLLISPEMFEKLGPAISSGRGMFLFGDAGNGKTSIAERVTAAFGKYIWIPRVIEVDGAIMRLYDPMVHHEAMPDSAPGLLDLSAIDKRWVRIRRPTIVVGGELTMDMLEVQWNSETNISEAPLQIKSNCGTLVIDDFGRQKIGMDRLLNRWIVPLERRYDFLNMAHGKKIQAPFDQMVIFSTNLEPKDMVDEAFLRRIPYKIAVSDPSAADFRKLLEIVCRANQIAYQADAVEYLIQTHYRSVGRAFRFCHPRDLVLQVKNYCIYNERPIELTNEHFDIAATNYFSILSSDSVSTSAGQPFVLGRLGR
jgi:hypothetical protein